MASLILGAINGIFTVLERVQLLRDLFAGNAQAGITVEEVSRAFRAELAAFFTLTELTNLQTIHSQFYGVWLPSVANRPSITANDISNPSGPLHHVFNNIMAAINTVFSTLNRMEAVYVQHSNTFHVDRVLQSQIMFMEMWGMLLHMHATYATLRRIQVGASTLDDSRLLTDTLSAILYLNNFERVLNWAGRAAVDRRLALLSEVRSDWGGIAPPLHIPIQVQRFFYDDTYRHLPTTPVRNQSHVASPPAWYAHNVLNGNDPNLIRSHVSYRRQSRSDNIRLALGRIAGNDRSAVTFRINSLRNFMRGRERLQRNTRTRFFHDSRPVQIQVERIPFDKLNINNEEDADREPHDINMLVVPVDLEEYLALSEYFSTSTLIDDGNASDSMKSDGSTPTAKL